MRGKIGVRMPLAIVAEEVIKSLLQWAPGTVETPHSPLAHHRGRIAGILEHLRHRPVRLWQWHLPLNRLPIRTTQFPICANGTMARVQPSKQRSTRWCADRRPTVRLGEARPLGCHSVEIWRLNQLLPVASQIALREVVTHHKDDVRLLRILRRSDRYGQREKVRQGANWIHKRPRAEHTRGACETQTIALLSHQRAARSPAGDC